MAGVVVPVAPATARDADVEAAVAARALGDKLLSHEPGPEHGAEAEGALEPGAVKAVAPAVDVKEGVVTPGSTQRRSGAEKPAPEGGVDTESAHAADGKVAGAAEQGPEDDLEAVLKNRSERVRNRLESKRQLEELESRVRQAEQAAREVAERAAKDPLGLLRQAGYTDEAIARALLGDSEPSDPRRPSKNDPVAARLEKLERLLEGRAEAERKAQESAAQAEIARGKEEVKRSFVGFVASDPDRFSHLCAHYDESPQELAEQALQIAETYRERTGKDTNFEAVAQYLESNLRTRYSKLQQRQQPQSEQTASASSPRKGQATLTPTDAAPRAATPRKDVADMTEEEARKEALRLANQLTRGRRSQ